MKRISAINVLSAVLLLGAVGVFVYLVIVPSMRSGQPGAQGAPDETPLPEVSIIAEAVAVPYSRIAFVSDRDGSQEIYTMNPDGSDVVRLTFNDALDLSPAWSPDGEWIAWLSEQGGQRDIHVMRADGSEARQITTTPDYEAVLYWSPDSQRIAYTTTQESGNLGLHMVDVSGENLAILSDGAPGGASWSPDGGQIAYVMYGDHPEEVAVLDMATGEVRRPLQGYNTNHPAWKPDGSEIVFGLSMPDGSMPPGLYMINPDGTVFAPVVEGPHVTAVAWSGWGTSLAYYDWKVGSSVPEASLFVIDGMGGEPVILTTITAPMGLDWSPDEQQLVYASQEPAAVETYRLYVANRDGSGVTLISGDFSAMQPDWSPYLGPRPEPTPYVPEATLDPLAEGYSETATLQAVLTQGAATPTPPPTPIMLALRVSNAEDASADICHVYVAEAGLSTQWGPDLLEGGPAIPPGEGTTLTTSILPGFFDVLATDCDHNVLDWELFLEHTGDGYEVNFRVIQSGDVLLIENQTEQAICNVYLSPSSGPEWVRSLMPPAGVIEPGGGRSFGITPDTYHAAVEFCDGTISEIEAEYSSGLNVWMVTE